MKLNTNIRKRFRVSNKVKKVASKDRFRLSISRSSKNISAQIIDDINNKTLISATSLKKESGKQKKKKSDISIDVATKLAEKAAEKKITNVYFDRGSYRFHGRIKVFADTLRKKGLTF